jgi:hypothetical protein
VDEDAPEEKEDLDDISQTQEEPTDCASEAERPEEAFARHAKQTRHKKASRSREADTKASKSTKKNTGGGLNLNLANLTALHK